MLDITEYTEDVLAITDEQVAADWRMGLLRALPLTAPVLLAALLQAATANTLWGTGPTFPLALS